MTLRFGLIGYGLFGRHHARCLAATTGAELGAICAASPSSRAAAAADHGSATVLADWRELIAADDLDAVDIVVPNHLHEEMAVAALEAGKHVLVEKPLATTVAGCERILAASRASGQLVAVGHELRFSRQWGTVKRLVDQGELGRPCYLNLSLFRHPYRPGSHGWRLDPARVGSWILEEPVHFYDLVLWYLEALGPPVSVVAHGTGGAGTSASFTSIIGFAGGPFAVVGQSLAGFGHHLLLELVGEDGALRTTWSAADARDPKPSFELQVKERGGSAYAIPIPCSGELVELEALIQAVVKGFAVGRTPLPPAIGAAAVRLCLEAERSLREGRSIAL